MRLRRDDYPVEVLWGVLLLTVALRHMHFEACLAELKRNAALRHLLGIDDEDGVPHEWNVSWFIDLLGQVPHRDRLRGVFDVMIRRLPTVVDDLGRHVAGEATAPRSGAASTPADRGHRRHTG